MTMKTLISESLRKKYWTNGTSDEVLEKKLRSIYDSDEFVLGVFTTVIAKEQREELLAAIENGWATESGEIIEYAMLIEDDAPFEED